ncbi:putative protein of unknown function [Bradyrhizobium sp. ORS 285]|nr:putative protein of unknown function [Bradyrhizobium sp. ORS 285]
MWLGGAGQRSVPRTSPWGYGSRIGARGALVRTTRRRRSAPASRRHDPTFSPQIVREGCVSLAPSKSREGQGRPGARRSHGPRATRKARGRTTGSAGTSRPSLRGWSDGLYVVSLVRRRFGHHDAREAIRTRARDTSFGVSGHHDFAVRNRFALVQRSDHVHRGPPPRIVTTRTSLCMRRVEREHRADLPDMARGESRDKPTRRAVGAWGICGECPSGGAGRPMLIVGPGPHSTLHDMREQLPPRIALSDTAPSPPRRSKASPGRERASPAYQLTR